MPLYGRYILKSQRFCHLAASPETFWSHVENCHVEKRNNHTPEGERTHLHIQ